jgi:CubicO group peptidase (beta-lactamase class C family)
VQEGELVLEYAAGSANLATGELLTPRHRFRVASHSKSFTAAGLMLLRERGRVKLDDTIGAFIPGLHHDVAQATLAQVMSHSAGLTRDGRAGNQLQAFAPSSIRPNSSPTWLGRLFLTATPGLNTRTTVSPCSASS